MGQPKPCALRPAGMFISKGYCLQVPEFQDLPASSIESLAHVLTEKMYPPKSVMYYQGNEVEDIFFVQQGNIKVCWSTALAA